MSDQWFQALVEETADDIARERIKAKYPDPGVFPTPRYGAENDWDQGKPHGSRRAFIFQVCGVDVPDVEVSLSDVLRRLMEPGP